MSRRNSILNIDEWLDQCPNTEPDSIIYDHDALMDIAQTDGKEDSAKLVNLFKNVIDKYAKIGLEMDLLMEHYNDVRNCINTYLNTLDKDVEDQIEKLCRYKQDLLNQIQKMNADLYLPPYVPDDNVTLLQQCKRFKTEFKKLNAVREKRMVEWKNLRDRQLKLCSTLGIESPEKVKTQTDIPTEDELTKFTIVVRDLEKEEKRRQEKYKVLKETIIKCMDLLENQDPLVLTQIEKPSLSEENLRKLTELHSKFEALYAKNQQKYEKLKERLVSLYDRLDITGPERNLFLETHSNCKPSVMAEMEIKIEEYEELKKQNIGKFIEKIHDELLVQCDSCYVSQEQRDAILSLATDPCEELLTLYETELERLKKYFEENREILEKFQKWRLMWKELIDLEIKASDPGRFNNRGGQLLAEEKKRKALQRNLPRVEKELIDLNNKYASKMGEKFKVFGTNLDEFIAGCWDELNHAKEVEKKERQKAKMTPSKGPAGRTGFGAPSRGTPMKRANGSRLLGPLSISEQEFEAMAVARPTSAKRPAKKFGK